MCADVPQLRVELEGLTANSSGLKTADIPVILTRVRLVPVLKATYAFSVATEPMQDVLEVLIVCMATSSTFQCVRWLIAFCLGR